MRFGVFAIALTLGVTVGSSALAADPKHVAQLKQVNSCEGCDLSGADLSGLILIRANLRNANLQGANLRNTSLLLSNLENANLENANFTAAYLYGSNLENTQLTSTDFTQAVLRSAKLQGADVCTATLIGTDLTDADVDLDSCPTSPPPGASEAEVKQEESLIKDTLPENP